MPNVAAAFRLLVTAMLAALLLACGSTPAPVTGPTSHGYYRVQPGDTLYRIARNHRQSVSDLTRWNQLADAADIRVGQLLRVTPPGTGSGSSGNTTPRPPTTPAVTPTPRPPATLPSLQWPADGSLLYRFDGQRNKGIGIAASAGAPVKAAATGKVVYTGSGIRNYGLLLIIKHDNGLLTTYAHNRKLLVKEGQQVAAGQPVAEAGSTGTDRVKVHFEVRQNSQAIDPLRLLPER